MFDDLASVYIISQVFITLSYAVVGSTYFRKKRKNILLSQISANVFMTSGFLMLGGFGGAIVCAIAIARDVIGFIIYKNRAKIMQNATTKSDWYWLCLWIVLLTIGAWVTAVGFFSLFWYFATLLFTISIWQKNIFTYRALGVATGACRLVYNIFLGNVAGIILEIILSSFIVAGFLSYVKELRRKR